MVSKFESKHGLVSRQPQELYMMFADMSNFVKMLPEDKKAMVTADYDSLHATVQGFSIGVKVNRREAYNLIELVDDGSPFGFVVRVHSDADSDSIFKCDFHIELEAELNLMMKTFLGPKIKSGLDKMVDSLVDISEGRVPSDIPSDFKF